MNINCRKDEEDPLYEVFTALLEEERISLNLAINLSMKSQGPQSTGHRTGRRHHPLRNVLQHSFGRIVPLTWEQLQASGQLGLRTVTKTTSLLQSHGQARSDWAKNQPLYNSYLKKHRFLTLRRLQAEIIETVTARNLELETLDRRLRGHKQAVKFKQALNKRWSALNNVVKAFNKEVDSLTRMGFPQTELPRRLTVEGLKTTGILYDEMWDLDRLSVKEDWAVFAEVRNGIDAMFRTDRAKEEKGQLQVEAARMLNWLESQVTVLIQLSEQICNPGPESFNQASQLPQPILLQLLVERLRMAKSFTRVKKNKQPHLSSPDHIPLLTEDMQQRYQGNYLKFLRTFMLSCVISFKYKVLTCEL